LSCPYSFMNCLYKLFITSWFNNIQKSTFLQLPFRRVRSLSSCRILSSFSCALLGVSISSLSWPVRLDPMISVDLERRLKHNRPSIHFCYTKTNVTRLPRCTRYYIPLGHRLIEYLPECLLTISNRFWNICFSVTCWMSVSSLTIEYSVLSNRHSVSSHRSSLGMRCWYFLERQRTLSDAGECIKVFRYKYVLIWNDNWNL